MPLSMEKIELSFGGFALVEYLLSKEKFKKNFSVLDIGGALGNHTKIMRKFGLNVDTIDKYEPDAEFKGDFNTFVFDKKYDMIFCSHVIEHQRNQGLFLDKIYDTLHDDGDLVISGPKHPAERFVEGHIASTILPVFLQILIYAGFDCKNGKMMSLAGIENSFIVRKSKNFKKNERNDTGYKWTKKHQSRSPIELIQGYEIKPITLYLHNCKVWSVFTKESSDEVDGFEKDTYGFAKVGLKLKIPKNYKKKNINFFINLHQNFFIFDCKDTMIGEKWSNSLFSINI